MRTFKRYVLPFGAGLFAVLLIVTLQGVLRAVNLENSKPFGALLPFCVLSYFYGIVKLSKSKHSLAPPIVLAISMIGYAAPVAFILWMGAEPTQ